LSFWSARRESRVFFWTATGTPSRRSRTLFWKETTAKIQAAMQYPGW
jgi:hypothetical protein